MRSPLRSDMNWVDFFERDASIYEAGAHQPTFLYRIFLRIPKKFEIWSPTQLSVGYYICRDQNVRKRDCLNGSLTQVERSELVNS